MNKILILDDDQDILEPLSIILESEGFKVETLILGKEIISKIETFKPDLLLLDIFMSGSDGREICKLLKSDPKSTNIPIVMMSAHPAGKLEASASGADDFIAKPFETNELLNILKKSLVTKTKK